jgi:hypothetical protein
MNTLILLSLAIGQGAAGPANPALAELLEPGLPIAGLTYKFPGPLLPDEFTPQQQQGALEKAADRHALDLFVRKSVVAPFTLKIDSLVDKQGQRQGQTVDLYFVAHGRLDSLTKKDILNQLMRSESKEAKSAAPRFLSDDDLRQRKIKSLVKDGLEERYARLDLLLLGKVQVTGVARNVKSQSPKSLTMVTTLDSRFADDGQFPNRWRAVQQQGDDKDQLGPPQPYAGFAGYVKVSQLSEPADSMLVEIHFAFHEPPAWFDGRNYIRAKLPIAIQSNVRTFRKQLLSASAH